MAEPPAPPPLDSLLAQAEWVRCLARRLASDDDTAEEAVQRVWLAAVERPPRELRSARGWLAVALANAVRRLRRGESRRALHERAAPCAGPSPAVDDVVARAELQERIARAVLALDEPYRTTVLLRYVDDLAATAVATRMGVPVETVRTRLRRAIERLRRTLVGGDARSRRDVLAPLLFVDAGRDGRSQGAGVGGVAVAGAKKSVAVVAAILLLGVVGAGTAALVSRERSGGGGPTYAEPVASGTVSAAAREPRRRAAPDDATSARDAAAAGSSARQRSDPEHHLRGIVVREDDTPVAGADIRAVKYPWRGTNVLNAGGYLLESAGPAATSAADGTFALPLRRGDEVSLRVRADGFAPTEFRQRQAGTTMRLVLTAGVRLRLVVVDPSGSGVAGLRLLVRAQGGPERGNASAEVTTDGSGTAVAAGLPPSGVADVRTVDVTHGNQIWWDVPLATSGESERRLELVPWRTLRGRVTDATTGAPIAGATVGIGWTADPAVTTGEDGSFVLPGWTGVGTREIAAFAAGCARAEAIVGTSDSIDFALRRGFAVRGRTVDGDGARLAGALVGAVASVMEGGDQRTSFGNAVSDDAGRFRIDGLDREMTHFLTAVSRGSARARIEVRPPSADAAEIDVGDVALGAPHAISGRAVDGDGHPIPWLHVEVTGPLPAGEGVPMNSYGLSQGRVTDADGRFLVPDLRPGRYVVAVEPYAQGQVPFETEATVAADREVTEVTLTRPATRTLLVRVRDGTGAPVPQFAVSASGESENDATGITSAEGDVVLHLLPGHEQLFVFPSDPSRPFLAPPESPIPPDVREMTIVLREGVFLDVAVLDAEGRGVAGAEVKITRPSGEFSLHRCGPDGRRRAVVERAESWTVTFDGFAGGVDTKLSGRVEAIAPATRAVVRAEPTAADRTLTVRVVTPDGVPVAGVAVFCTDGPGHRGVGATGADGRITVKDLAPREMFVSAHPGEGFAAPRPLRVVPSGQEVVLKLRRTSEIRGVVVEASGAPAKAVVAAETAEGPLVTAPTADDGSFVLSVPEDEPGPFLVAARRAHDRPVAGEVADVAPGASGLRIVLASPEK